MAQYGGPEGAIASVIATLSANIPAAIDARWAMLPATLSDGTSVPNVKPALYLPHERRVITAYPAYEVFAAGFGDEENHGADWNTVTHALYIHWYIVGGMEAQVQEQCARYAWATYWVIKKHQQLDGNIPNLLGVDVAGKAVLSPLGKAKQAGKIMQIGQLPITVRIDEQPFF